MVRKLCCLCFDEKFNPIDIFHSEGVKPKIASTIRVHFPYEISEDDVLTKFVCSECWTKVDDFHTFYCEVDTARSNYLKNSVKEKPPAVLQVNSGTDEIEFDSVIFTIKNETLDNFVDEIETPNSDNVVIEASEPQHSHQNDDILNASDIGNVDNDDDWIDRNSSCSDKDFANERDPDWNTTGTANELLVKAEETLIDDRKKTCKYDHLMSRHMSMKCEVCGHPFESLVKAISHYRKEHKMRSVWVTCCERRLSIRDIRYHIRYHLNPDVFKCSVCNKRWKTDVKLRKHMVKHAEKRFKCDICKKMFAARQGVRLHILKKHVQSNKELLHECHICKKRLTTKGSLQIHVKNMHETTDRQAVCHICAKVYTTTGSLRVHMQTHSDIKQPPHVCKLCGNSFQNKRGLIKHMNRHQDDGKTFACSQCPKIATSRSALAGHIRVVHNFTAIECPSCDKVFKRPLALKEHLATHTGQNLYSCVYCPKSFKSSANMYKHFRESHPVAWSADRKSKPRGNQRTSEMPLKLEK